MEHSTAIKSIQDGTTLEFSDRAGEYYRVSLHGPDFRGACRVYAFEPASHLSGFFRDLAADWRGWQGTKEWASLEGELRFSATCDSTGHISLSVRLRSGQSPLDWSLAVVLLIEAGQLEQVASGMEKFFNHDCQEGTL